MQMNEKNLNEALDLIHEIALKSKNKCDEPIPEIIRLALEDIAALARYKGKSANSIAPDRRKLYGLPEN